MTSRKKKKSEYSTAGCPSQERKPKDKSVTKRKEDQEKEDPRRVTKRYRSKEERTFLGDAKSRLHTFFKTGTRQRLSDSLKI